MLGRARQPLFAAEDVRDFHEMIVHDVGQVVRRQTVRLHEHLHVDALILELDGAAAQILDDARPFVRHPEPQDVRLTGGLAARDLLRRIGEAQPVVARRLAGGPLRNAHLLESLGRAETFERVPLCEQLRSVFAIDGGALALTIRPVRTADVRTLVPRKPAPAQRLQDRPLALGRAAHLIGVFDAQDELAAVLLGEAVVDERHVGGAHVRIARRRRRDARSNLRHAENSLCLSRPGLYACRTRAGRNR